MNDYCTVVLFISVVVVQEPVGRAVVDVSRKLEIDTPSLFLLSIAYLNIILS